MTVLPCTNCSHTHPPVLVTILIIFSCQCLGQQLCHQSSVLLTAALKSQAPLTTPSHTRTLIIIIIKRSSKAPALLLVLWLPLLLLLGSDRHRQTLEPGCCCCLIILAVIVTCTCSSSARA